jgi:hypothetical protein
MESSGSVILGNSATSFDGINDVSVTSDDLRLAILDVGLLLDLQMVNEVVELLSTQIHANLKKFES